MCLISLVTTLAEAIVVALHAIKAILATLNWLIALIADIPSIKTFFLMLFSFLFSLSLF